MIFYLFFKLGISLGFIILLTLINKVGEPDFPFAPLINNSPTLNIMVGTFSRHKKWIYQGWLELLDRSKMPGEEVLLSIEAVFGLLKVEPLHGLSYGQLTVVV